MPYKNIEDRHAAEKRYRQSHQATLAQKRAEKVQWFKELKSSLSCSRCPESDPVCLDFHHRDPVEKDFQITRAIRRYGKDRIMKEIEKCDILCANCHRKLHAREN